MPGLRFDLRHQGAFGAAAESRRASAAAAADRASTEDVGERFAEEARRIHYNEAPERGIRGVTSKEEAESLEEEGIKVMPMPFARLLKDPLQ